MSDPSVTRPARKPHVRPMGGWWKRDPFFMRYMVRETTAFAVVIYALVLTVGVVRLAQGEAGAARQFRRLADYSGRGVVTTATYEARAHGVHSGMGLMKAALRAPQAVLLPTDFEQYRAYSRRFKAAVAELAPTIEDRGIDDIYIDLTDVPGAQEAVGHDATGGVRAVAQEIRNSVRSATGSPLTLAATVWSPTSEGIA